MTNIVSSYWRSVSLLFAMLLFVSGMVGNAFAVPGCQEADSASKYWEYRDFLIDAGTGGESGKGKKGLAKGKNQIKGRGVKEALSVYLRKKHGWSTNDHVEAFTDIMPRLDGFYGGSGLLGEVWLEIARKAVARYGIELGDTDKIDIKVWGRINETNAEPNSGELGYAYNASNRSGHIWATMCFEIRFAGTNDHEDPDAKIRYSLKTEVAECGFKVIPRGEVTGNAPVFVGSYMKWLNSQVPAEFNTKLEAVNFLKGDTPTGHECPDPGPANGYVTITKVFFDKDGNDDWVDWSNNSEKAHLLKPDAQACVDLFFQATEPPAIFLADSPRPNYCLGRCSDPPIANSGM